MSRFCGPLALTADYDQGWQRRREEEGGGGQQRRDAIDAYL